MKERRDRKQDDATDALPLPSSLIVKEQPVPAGPNGHAILCAVRSKGRTFDFALREAEETGRRLYLLFVREQRFLTDEDHKRKWRDDGEAREIFHAAKQSGAEPQPLFCYAVSESPAATIVDIAATVGASRLILGAPKRNAFVHLLRGNVIREVSDQLPEEIDLLVYA